MPDVILHSLASRPSLQRDGELRPNPDARALRLRSLDDAYDLPLDVQPLPPAPPGDLVCIQGSTGATWAALTQGGGGRSYDASPWRVPGVTPLSFADWVLPAGEAAQEIVVTQPLHLQRLAVKCRTAGEVTFGLRTTGAPAITLAQATVQSAGGLETVAADVILQPGRYQTFCMAPGTTVAALVGAQPWTLDPIPFPVFLSSVAP